MTRRTLEHAFAQDDFNRFAALSGDANPIHVDAAFAARTRFGPTACCWRPCCAVWRQSLPPA